MEQLGFQFQSDENTLKDYLANKTEREISLVITDNSSTMLSLRKENRRTVLRLHRMFLSAEGNVLEEIADFIKGRKKRTPGIRDYIDRNAHLLKKGPARKVNVRPEGKNYNLLDIYHSVNEEYFEGRVSASITWGTKRPRRAAAKRTLGSYSSYNNMIRISPMLDSRNVPSYFVEFVVYHEMLHADIGIKKHADRRTLHAGEFRRREKLFKHYHRAVAWEKRRW